MTDVNTLGPMSVSLEGAWNEVQLLKRYSKHWNCCGKRSIATAVSLLQKNLIIAIPTDTIYGLACIASSRESIERLYAIKKRDAMKPLSISVSDVKDIDTWGFTDHLPQDLLSVILPGPYTIILKRKSALNPALNPNLDTIGIRVPNYNFINYVTKLTGPLALTSANMSNEQNCIHASEFKSLWPFVDAIFHDNRMLDDENNKSRLGSTVVDLSQPNQYKIVRFGEELNYLVEILKKCGLQETK